MTTTKIKRADVIYNSMLMADSLVVSDVSLKVMKSVQNEDVHNQILGLASTLLCLADQYGLEMTNILSEADNVVFSGGDNNMLPEFKNVITQFTKEKWELN